MAPNSTNFADTLFSKKFFNAKFPKVTDIDKFVTDAHLSSILKVKHDVLGKSAQGRSIHSIFISSMRDHSNETPCGTSATLLLVAGLHAREWVTIGGALCLIDRLIYEKEPQSSELVALRERIDSGHVALHVVLLANPDGYSFTRTKKRHWRRNRNVPPVDLNRNFGVFNRSWGFGTSSNASELNQGMSPFSEPESKALGRFVESSKDACENSMLLDIHCCARVVYPPFIYRNGTSLDAVRMLRDAGHLAARRSGYKFKDREKHFSKSNTGVFIDWAFGEVGLRAAFMLEVRGAPSPKSFRALFRNAATDQCPVGLEIAGALDALAEYQDAMSNVHTPAPAHRFASAIAPSTSPITVVSIATDASAYKRSSEIAVPSALVYFEAMHVAAFGTLLLLFCTCRILRRYRKVGIV